MVQLFKKRLVLEIEDRDMSILEACREFWRLKNSLRNDYNLNYEYALIHRDIYLVAENMQESLESMVERYHAMVVDIERGKV